MADLQPALILAAHGSKAAGWTDAIAEFGALVAESPGIRDAFSLVQVAYLDHSLPRLTDAATIALSSGCSEVIVVPLFLGVSQHPTEDVPGLLGLDVPPRIHRRLLAEGQRPLAAGLPIRIVALGDVVDLLALNIQRRLSLRSQQREREAVVLCAYGSAIRHEAWETLLYAIRRRLMREGWGVAVHAYVGHASGASPAPTADAIVSAARQASIERVHVVPLLMGVSKLQTGLIQAACADAARRIAPRQLSYACDAILPDGDLAARVARLALGAVGVFFTAPVAVAKA